MNKYDFGGKQMKKILLAASEAVPVVKTGGLADVTGALPKYFDKEKFDVRVIIPKYACMDSSLLGKFHKIAEGEVSLSWRKQYAGVLEGQIEGITYYLIDNEYYFAGPAPYDNIFLDAEKFAYFSKAVLTVLPLIDFQPDIIHCNDWQTGLLPVFLKAQFQNDSFYRHIKTIFTIHNMRFQGRWYIDAYRDITGLPDEYFTMDKLESYGQANPLKGGVVFSDLITTVSESYALEIQQQSGGEGLDGLMRARADQLYGILNGIDNRVYDPKTDQYLYCNFDEKTWKEKKGENKKCLQKEMGLKEQPDAFLIGMVSRLTDQKGYDLVMSKIDEMMSLEGVQIALQGTGEAKYENMLKDYEARYPGRIAAQFVYSERTAHRIYGSADALLMPSMFEPCGLSQLMSMRYGTVPMVRETGGLKDTVLPYNSETKKGTGFTFFQYSPDEMMKMITCAYETYMDKKEAWAGIALQDMKQDFSWAKSADKYAELYEMLCKIKESEECQEKLLEEAKRTREEVQKQAEAVLLQKSVGRQAEQQKRKESAGTRKKTTSSKRRKTSGKKK